MATTFAVDQEVYAPRSLVGLDPNTAAGPFLRTKVREVRRASLKVDLPGNPPAVSGWVGKSRIVSHLGILVVRIGDYREAELLDPLCKSVLHYCRMLLPGDCVRLVEVRTAREMLHFWATERLHTLFEQVVLIAHGDNGHIYFGNRGLSANAVGLLLSRPSPRPKEVISLCCQTGQAPFGKALSLSRACRVVMAPFHSVHGAIASQFCQAYLTCRVLEGRTIGVAFKRARNGLIGAASFRLWENGKLKANR